MSTCIDVHVIDADGDPVSGKRVCILIMGDVLGITDEFMETDTDYEGHAEFESATDYYDGNPIRIMVGSHDETQEIGGNCYTVQLD